VRNARIVVRVALIAALATVAVPALAISRPTSSEPTTDPSASLALAGRGLSGSTTTMLPRPFPYPLDAYRDLAAPLPDLAAMAEAPARPRLEPVATPSPVAVATSGKPWHHDPDVSWYGPGFYGGRTACGITYTTTTLGVANRTLPCGTMVTFRNPANGRTITVPVIDRGPYVAGRQWDLSGATCLALEHCYTGEILWRLA
jgi:rare lipoprotein A (RlpA)-like double-psi beta-barrel protein